MGNIRLLPDHLINQIAAGEVVERPASVLKEVLENAADAEASSITIRFSQGGRSLIQVEDNGTGMGREDALLALERHATSKITSVDDLLRLATLGFRGEALPSIASVSRMTLLTSDGSGEGTRVQIDGGRITSVEPAYRERGTTVTVRDLFFNLPGRRKFLRSPATETRHLWRIIQGAALPNPQLGFKVYDGNDLAADLPAAESLQTRMSDLYGESLFKDLVTLESSQGPCSAVLFTAREHSQFHGAHIQFAFVNRRHVRDRFVTGALLSRIKKVFPHHPQPVYLLFLDLPAEEVDFNVHPAKLEVRFRDTATLFTLMDRFVEGKVGQITAPGPIPVVQGPKAGFHGIPSSRSTSVPSTPGFRSAMTRFGEELKEHFQHSISPDLPFRYIGSFRDAFLLFDHENELKLVDQHAAHERILYERLLRGMADGETGKQHLLPPVTIELLPEERSMVKEATDDLTEMGFEVEIFGDRTLSLRAHPIGMTKSESVEFIRAYLRESKGDRNTRTIASLACRSAIKIHSPLAPEKAIELYRNLLACEDPHHCPHGRPTILVLSQDQLFAYFKRT
ncbi:MAG TPA: DNA mismatch repair endonuclease MutL [Thermoanaerobaculia bacterium]|nr:DNA mismatch repair endonuclease MutL [Thermoanaerobaculia bacterium]HUM29004.1 DNA mismatch repair endonuclease MutL [Thermoanaerobaculia bacterium]HXK67440.1 DNA mismatch repair endonuclease MutL [Thermoanaerobaculia bacterium]